MAEYIEAQNIQEFVEEIRERFQRSGLIVSDIGDIIGRKFIFTDGATSYVGKIRSFGYDHNEKEIFLYVTTPYLRGWKLEGLATAGEGWTAVLEDEGGGPRPVSLCLI